jgi:hypothetical protein
MNAGSVQLKMFCAVIFIGLMAAISVRLERVVLLDMDTEFSRLFVTHDGFRVFAASTNSDLV